MNIAICCPQQHITGRYAEPEECSPQYRHRNAWWGNAYVKSGDKK